MKKISLDTWIQLVGMLSVVAGLIFVGIEMRQTQRVALAEQELTQLILLTPAFDLIAN